MSYDYIVVGGGSAGCVLANRLSADRSHRVLLLEAGGWDWHPYIHVPGLTMRACLLPGIMWDYQAEPDPSRSGATAPWMAGRVLGGGSSVNGVVWVRGHPGDFDRWADLGCEGWDWEGVKPYFLRTESFERRDPYRGSDGPVQVAMVRAQHEITDAFVAAADAAGHAYLHDYNGERQEGVGYGQTNVRRGFRHSAAHALPRFVLASSQSQGRDGRVRRADPDRRRPRRRRRVHATGQNRGGRCGAGGHRECRSHCIAEDTDALRCGPRRSSARSMASTS